MVIFEFIIAYDLTPNKQSLPVYSQTFSRLYADTRNTGNQQGNKKR